MSKSSCVERAATWRLRLVAADLRPLLGIALLAFFLAHSLHHLEVAPLRRADDLLYDMRVRWFARAAVDERIAIVDIDERSLAALGRWPWHRARLAELVERIFADYGALLLGLDVILAEPDESSGLPSLEALARGPLRQNAAFQAALAELRPTLDYDGRLAAVISRYPVVLGFHFSTGAGAAQSGELPAAIGVAAADLAAGLTRWSGYGANLPRLQQAATAGGFLGAPVDADGVTRRGWLLAMHDGQIYAALSLAMAQVLLGHPALQLSFAEAVPGRSGAGPLVALELASARGPVRVPVDQQAAVLENL